MGTSFSKISNYESFIYACKTNNLQLAKKIYENNKINIHLKDNKAFSEACISSSLNIIDWLSGFENTNIKNRDLIKLIKVNNLEVIIILTNKNKINLNNKLFEISCLYHLDIVMWIYGVGNIDINANSNRSFFNACSKLKYDIIDWFLLNGVNLENKDDYIFKKLCEIKNLEVVKYLCNVNKRYEYIESDNTIIPIIKDKDIYLIENNLWPELINYFNILKLDDYEVQECPISLDETNFITNCGHHFKIDEIMNWYLKKNTCPLCESKIILSECIVSSTMFTDNITS